MVLKAIASRNTTADPDAPDCEEWRAPFTGVRHAARLIFVLLAGLAQV